MKKLELSRNVFKITDILARIGEKIPVSLIKVGRKILQNRITTLQYEHILEHLFDSESMKNVIEIGAMDGKYSDSLYPYLRTENKIKALFVEPIEDNFIALKENYKDWNIVHDNQFYFENVALIPEAEEVGLTRVPTSVVNTVKSVTLSSLLKKYNLDNIDILQIKTKRYSHIIIEQALSLIFPKLIYFEWGNKSLDEQESILNLIWKKGYLFCSTFDQNEAIACKPEIYHQLNLSTYSKHSVLLIPHNFFSMKT